MIYSLNIYRKTTLLGPGMHTFSKANFGWIKLPVTKNYRKKSFWFIFIFISFTIGSFSIPIVK